MPNDEAEELIELTYTGVHIHKHDHVIVPTIIDEYAEDRRTHALVYHWIKEEWLQQLIEDSICGVSSLNEPRTKVFNVGVNGKVVVAEIPGKSIEYVDKTDRGPNYSEMLRCVRAIDQYLYTAGMARQVYRREGPNNWVQWDNGVYVPRGQREQAVGFLDISGFSDGTLYAAGYKGEIWYFDSKSKKWIQEDSPTNLALTCITCTQNGDVYIAGLAGTIIKGSHNDWKVIDQEITKDDFWGITVFNDCIYFANYGGVYMLSGTALIPVSFGLGKSVTTAYIHANDGVMWSVGQKDLILTTDGITWIEIEKP